MHGNEDEDTRIYEVVMNHEEQYSIWLQSRPVPAGWTTVGKSGLKGDCLAHIEVVWTDMRPLSLRKHMEAYEAEQAKSRQEAATAPSAAYGTAVPASSAAPGSH
jgi:MbtH protein